MKKNMNIYPACKEFSWSLGHSNWWWVLTKRASGWKILCSVIGLGIAFRLFIYVAVILSLDWQSVWLYYSIYISKNVLSLMDCKYQILIMYIKQLTISDYRFGNIDLQIYRKIDNQFFLAHWWTNSIPVTPASVVRPSVVRPPSTFSNIFSSETTGPIKLKFHMETP